MLCLVLGKIWEINRMDIYNEMEEMKECILNFSIRSHSLDLGTIRDGSLCSIIFYILIFYVFFLFFLYKSLGTFMLCASAPFVALYKR
jgi:hypothetical protein